MNAEDITFGVEIETLVPLSSPIRIGAYHAGATVPYLPAGWTAQHDGSIQGDGRPCEIVSPVLRGHGGLMQVWHAIEALRANGHSVNASCGVHVHVGWSPDLPAQALARLVTIVAYLECGLYAITGTVRPQPCDNTHIWNSKN